MLHDYYYSFFPTPDKENIMKQQVLLADCIDGFSPDVTDDMEYAEFIDWYNTAVDIYGDEEDA